MKIALDVLGGDNSPLSTIEGAFSYLDERGNSAAELILLGNKTEIVNTIKNLSREETSITIHHTTQKIEMNERSSRIFREKPDSSLVKSIELVRDKKAHAAVSAGNTGALLASSLFLIGKIPGIRRPAFAPFIPTNKGGFILCDAGANADTKPRHLLQFALMATAYMEHLENCHNPRVALLNIGLEENKGNDLTKNAYPILKDHIHNFIGNIESRSLFEGEADIIICDGFTGNIVLKLSEGIITHLMEWIQERVETYFPDIDISSIYQPAINDISASLDPEEHGATPLLGINGIIMKCHGSSTKKGIKNSLIATEKTIRKNLIKDIATKISNYSNIIDNSIIKSEKNPV